MVHHAAQDRGVSIRRACEARKVSQTCYRYVAKAEAENEEVADWLLRFTDNHRNWGFGLCMAHARRKFHDLHASHQSQIAGQALELCGALYGGKRGGRPACRRAQAYTAGTRQANHRNVASVVDRATPTRAGGLGYRKRYGLQPQALGGADTLS
jgi:hypothetical protein